MGWGVILHQEVHDWYLDLAEKDPESAHLVGEAIDLLADLGPALGRPLADKVNRSRHHSMKELRPGSVGATEIRLLFAFDPARQALLLVAGDKSGSWNSWYDHNIPIAEARFDRHLRDLNERLPDEKP